MESKVSFLEPGEVLQNFSGGTMVINMIRTNQLEF